MKVKINPEFKRLIPPLEKEEYEQLESSIKNEGCRDALILWKDMIVDGHNRYEICSREGIKFKTRNKKFKDKNEVILWMIDNQLGRRNISKYDRARLALTKEKLLKPIAKANLKTPTGGKNRLTLQKSAKSIDIREQIKKIANVSHDTVSKVKYIEKKANEKQKKDLSAQKISINKVYNKLKNEENRKKMAKKLKSQPLPLKKVGLILADPPWRYDFSSTDSRKVENQYPTMDLEDIKKLKLPSEENAILFLWATAPKLREALEVVDAWGFEYKTHAIWNKEIIGMGYWFRGQHELLIVATKGNVRPPKESLRKPSIFSQKRGRHSEKPEIIYKMIEEMFPDLKYLELFSRKKRVGWISWGNEI